MRFHVRGIDHLRVCGSTVASEFAEQVFPNAAPGPADEAIVDGRVRAIFGRAVAPATATFQDLHDAANDAPIILPFDASHVCRQMSFNSFPLLVAQPKQIAAHDPDPLQKTNQDRIVSAEELMSFDPSKPMILVPFESEVREGAC